MPQRLRRSAQSEPGLTRRRYGRGFAYLDHAGIKVDSVETLARIDVLAIPPAWRDVWICRDGRGHLQATGTDGSGRRQYIYHERWRELRDREKFEQMIDFGRALPKLRRRIRADLAATPEALSRERVLATAARLLDVGLFRIGSHENEDLDTGLGLATVRREHVTVKATSVGFDYPAKSGVRRVICIEDPDTHAIVSALRRRRSGPEELLAYRSGASWSRLHADDINDYIKAGLDDRFSAKDFRTWNATVLAATSLAGHLSRADEAHPPAAKRVFSAVCTEVSEALGNTPAVARRSYIDPRLFDLFESGIVAKLPHVPRRRDPEEQKVLSERVRRRLELAVIELLG